MATIFFGSNEKVFWQQIYFWQQFQLASIPSNIAEGSSRSSDKDHARFIEISLGSCFELETQILIAKTVNNTLEELANAILKDIDEEQKMLVSFINKLQ